MKKILFFTFAVLLFSCKQEKDPKTELLYGAWNGSAWIIAGQPDNNAKSVHFEFKADGTYSAGFGGQAEKGTFKLKESKLYTTAENKIEKMVALSKLTKDSIVMDMNRQGQAEQLFLIKK